MANEAFKRRLAAIPEAIRKDVGAALVAAGEAMAGQMRSVAPHGKTGNLARSIRVEPALGVMKVRVRAGGPATRKHVRAKGGSPEIDYAVFQEFGTRKMPAHPFFYPVYRLTRRALKRRISKAIRDAVQRYARANGLGG